jgi:hypothetical protein
MAEDHTEVNDNVRGTVRVTITEAATLLGVHPNTVRSRVRAGVFDAEKVSTEHGFTWMINPDSLVNTPLPRDSQHPPQQPVNSVYAASTTPMKLVQDLLKPFVEDLGRVREELGAERVRREQAEQERDELRSQLEALQAPPEPRDSPETTASEVADWIDAPPRLEGPETPTESRRASWWRSFFGFD